jgi:hypothetical protein
MEARRSLPGLFSSTPNSRRPELATATCRAMQQTIAYWAFAIVFVCSRSESPTTIAPNSYLALH